MTTEIQTTEEVKKEIKQVRELSPEAREYNRQMQIAHTLSRSTIVPTQFRGEPDDIYACVMLGSELGMKTMMALNSIVIIQGNATLKAQTMLAVVRARCPDAVIEIDVDSEKLTAVVVAKRNKEDYGYKAVWTMDTAKMMNLSHKDNYIKQPATMLRWRAISEALRTVFADVLMGIYATEDLIDSELTDKKLRTISNEEKAKQLTEKFSQE